MRRILTILLYLSLASSALASGPAVTATSTIHKNQHPKRFFTAGQIAAQSVYSIAMNLDIASTRSALHVSGMHESNPLAQSPASMVLLKAGALAGGMAMSYGFYRIHCYKTAKAIPLILAVPSGVAAAHNFGIRR